MYIVLLSMTLQWPSVCVCASSMVVWTLIWLHPTASEAEASPSASSGSTVGNSGCVIVSAMNCWWRICLCSRLNNGNIKYLAQIIIIHFLATTELWLISWKLKISKQAFKRGYFVDAMKICLHTPFVVNITSELCAPLRGSAFCSCTFFWKIITLRDWLEIQQGYLTFQIMPGSEDCLCLLRLSRSMEILIKLWLFVWQQK